jgi:Asp-tRNA(Asn)/Glu-tRNA(Gln) amidotransferase A subunit family amidase
MKLSEYQRYDALGLKDLLDRREITARELFEAHHSNDGLPVGVQCAARVSEEATLIRLAAQFERARPWAGRRPLQIPE